MWVRPLRHLTLIISVACLLLVAGFVIWRVTMPGEQLPQSTSSAPPPTTQPTPQETESAYHQTLTSVAAELSSLLGHELTVADSSQLASARDRLANSVVPSARQSQHLKLVLKLSLLLELLKPNRVTIASAGRTPKPGVVQGELRELVQQAATGI